METCKRLPDAAKAGLGMDLVIEELDEFAVGCSGTCYCTTNADYVVNTPAPVAIG